MGMAGAGKSTVGKVLANKLGYDFIDEVGEEEFKKTEAETIIGLQNIDRTIISPGGSVIYSDIAMEHLKKISKLILLDVPFEIIEQRVDISKRGLVGMKNKTLRELYNERRPLYLRHADTVLLTGGQNPEMLAHNIAFNINLLS